MASWTYVLLALVAAASAAPGPQGRIVGGTQTSIEEFPYIVALVYTYRPGITVQRCVGCLISSWHVLTSGFCFTGAIEANMVIRAGSTNSLSGGVMNTIDRVVKHDDYTETPRTNDISVVFVRSPYAITNVVNIMFLPPQNTYIPDGHEVKVVSWGFEYLGGPQLELLKYILLNKLPLIDCAAMYADNDQVEILDTTICAYASGRGMCQGDAGAPMAIDQVVVGLTSYYRDCDGSKADVFTRIDRYTNWILGATASSGDATRAYAGDIRPQPVVKTIGY